MIHLLRQNIAVITQFVTGFIFAAEPGKYFLQLRIKTMEVFIYPSIENLGGQIISLVMREKASKKSKLHFKHVRIHFKANLFTKLKL